MPPGTDELRPVARAEPPELVTPEAGAALPEPETMPPELDKLEPVPEVEPEAGVELAGRIEATAPEDEEPGVAIAEPEDRPELLPEAVVDAPPSPIEAEAIDKADT